MKRETVEKLIAAKDRMYKAMNLPNFSSGMKEEIRIVERTLAELKKTKNLRSYKASLEKADEPTPTQLYAALELMRLFPYRFRKMLIEAGKDIDHHPGGRPRFFEPDDCAKICAEINAIHGTTTNTLGQIIADVAQKYKATPRTVQRIWNNRTRHQPVFTDETETE